MVFDRIFAVLVADAGHANLAFRRRQEAAKHADGGGFARAVGAEEAEDFAAADLKGNMVGGRESAVADHEITGLDHDPFPSCGGRPGGGVAAHRAPPPFPSPTKGEESSDARL